MTELDTDLKLKETKEANPIDKKVDNTIGNVALTCGILSSITMATILAPISIILGVMAHSKGQRFGIISILLGVTAIIVMNIPSNYFTSKSSKRSNVKQNSFNSSSNNYIPSRSIEQEINDFAEREYPNDYRMQKYIYNQQVDAKSFMKNASNKYSKSKAQREYPNDYRMQKYIYNK